MAITTAVKEIILDLCRQNPEKRWDLHVSAVVKSSLKLGKQLMLTQQQLEIVELAAWLHDIEKIKGNKELHHVKGANTAEIILKEHNYPQDKIDQVKHCIITHSSDTNYQPESIEAKIVSDADALSHFSNIHWLIYFSLKKGETFEESREALLKKMDKCWKKLRLNDSRGLAKEKYDAIKMLFSE